MKIAAGIFAMDEVSEVTEALEAAGFSAADLSFFTATQTDEAVDLLRQEPEQTAVQGALLGGALGSVMGLLGSIAVIPIPGVGPVLASGIMATATGGAVGTFLGSIYSVRAESRPVLRLKEALAEGQVLVAVHVTEDNAARAEQVLRDADGEIVNIYEVHHQADE
ncbi:MAG: hypothetical protein KC425_14730 [Anaerolineales bacterium]|nr:hypothetical protein [Anaerolineales bacterium]